MPPKPLIILVALDFFGAMRAATYDNQIRQWISDTLGTIVCIYSSLSCVLGVPNFTDDAVDMSQLSRHLIHKTNLPDFAPVQLTPASLIHEGNRLAAEQQRINDTKLSQDYLRMMKGPSISMIGFS